MAGAALMSMEVELELQVAELGYKRFFNPGCYLLSVYRWWFRWTAGAAIREQEILADRRAAVAHGSSRLADAMVNIVDAAVRFDAKLRAIEAELLARGGTLANIYTYEPTPRPSEAELATKLETTLAGALMVRDLLSIPERLARIEALDLPAPRPSEAEPLASVIHDRAALDVGGCNSYRIHLERKLNKFIKLDPELEEAVHRR